MAWITPYTVAPRGRQRRAQTRYRVVFRHPTRLNARGERVETSRGGFKTLDVAEVWREQLERAEAMGTIEMLAVIEDRVGGDQETLAALIERWFVEDLLAPGGVAVATAESYRLIWNNHLRPIAGSRLVAEFADPKTSLQVRAKLRQGGVGLPTQARAMKILSSALSWAVEVEGSLSVNGALALGGSDRRRRRRRSQRVVSRPSSPSAAAARALTAADVVAIQLEALARRAGRPARFAARDAAAIELIFDGGHRPQEIWGARWGDIDWPAGRRDRGVLWVNWVLSEGELADAKTEGSHRPAPLLPRTAAVLRWWRETAVEAGLPAGPDDFIFPGAAPDGHLTRHQQHQWPARCFKPAALAASQSEQHAYLAGATPYSCRRGHISSRLAAGEDIARVAEDCGTSTEMIHRHYLQALERGRSGSRRLDAFAKQLDKARKEAEVDLRSHSNGPRADALLTRLSFLGLGL
jgi:integrase